MGCACLVKLVDAILFLAFLGLAVVVPLFDAQSALPAEYYPKQLVDLNSWYANEFGDYLVAEKPHFFVGLVWVELLLLWPLSVASLCALLTGKSWYRTTTLIFGVSCFTSMAAIMGDLLKSGRASEKLLMVYSPFMGIAVLAVLRGLIPCVKSCSPAGTAAAPAKKAAHHERKKKAY
ncbi:hypothetical protein V2J09_015747 [Rumex salicifolius]